MIAGAEEENGSEGECEGISEGSHEFYLMLTHAIQKYVCILARRFLSI